MKKTWIMAALFAVAGLVGSASASTVTNGGTTATNSNFGVITIQADGSYSVTQVPTAGPGGNGTTTYDGVEDVVYNVINKSNVAFTGFTVIGTGIAGFDGDGIDNYATPTGTGLGFYGQSAAFLTQTSDQAYAGWANGVAADANTYSGYVAGGSSVVVTFGGGGIAASAGGVDGSAFISFEAPGGASGSIGFAPLPPAVWSGLALVLGIAGYTKFAKTKIA